jgi:Flp pilus assembly protein TadD
VSRDQDPEARSDAHVARGIELADRGWLDEAAREFQRAVELDPRSSHARDHLAAVHAERGRWREALAEHLAALALDPGNAAAHYHLASFLAASGPEMAVAEFRESIRLEPEHADAHLGLGMALADQGEGEEARRELAEAIRLDPRDAFARHELAALLMDEADYRGAIGHLKEVVRLEPDGFEAHLDLGICYAQKGFYAEAERAYARARELRPGDALVNYNVAALYALWGRAAASLEALRLALGADAPRVRGWLASDPMFEALRGRPEFEALARG